MEEKPGQESFVRTLKRVAVMERLGLLRSIWIIDRSERESGEMIGVLSYV